MKSEETTSSEHSAIAQAVERVSERLHVIEMSVAFCEDVFIY